MLTRLRPGKPSPALVISCLALFVALSGSSYAVIVLPKNSVGTKQIRNNAVKSSKIADNQITGADVNEATLGQVPSAASAGSANTANTATTATNAGTASLLDGIDSTGFAPAAVETVREVGAASQPPFNNTGICAWSNFEAAGTHATAAFYKDPWGVVHLKGLVKATDIGAPPPGYGCGWDASADRLIFTLPAGYRPAKRSVFMVITNQQVGRVNIDSNGDVSVDWATPNMSTNIKAWLSLEGLTFRAS